MEPVLKFEKRINFNNNICEDLDMSLVVETVEQSTKNECLICMNEGANVICKHCNNSFHLHCLYISYQSKSKHIYNGRCPYCTNALPICHRIHLSGESINTWLKNVIIEDDEIMRCKRSINRALIASVFCDVRLRDRTLRACSKLDYDEYIDALASKDENRLLYLEHTKSLVVAIYRVFKTFKNSFDRSYDADIMRELLKLSERLVIEIDEPLIIPSLDLDDDDIERSNKEEIETSNLSCSPALTSAMSASSSCSLRSLPGNELPSCSPPLTSAMSASSSCPNCLIEFENTSNSKLLNCKHCNTTWSSFEYQTYRFLMRVDRTDFSNATKDEVFELYESSSELTYTELSSFIESEFKKLSNSKIDRVDIERLKTLIKEAIVPLAYRTLELTPNAVIFSPLKRKRDIARHAYLIENQYRLLQTLKATMYPETTVIKLFELKPTLDEIEAELELVDELIIENSIESKLV